LFNISNSFNFNRNLKFAKIFQQAWNTLLHQFKKIGLNKLLQFRFTDLILRGNIRQVESIEHNLYNLKCARFITSIAGQLTNVLGFASSERCFTSFETVTVRSS
jgi:hypothetical protein